MKKFFCVVIGFFLTIGLFACTFTGNPSGDGDDTTTTTEKPEFLSGSGSETDPYLIDQGYQWQNVNKHLNAFFRLQNNINLGDKDSVLPIGSALEPFTGTVDGQGYSIAGATIASKNHSGLFGVVSGGTIKNLKFQDSKVTLIKSGSSAMGSFVGALKTGGIIENCQTENIRCYYDCNSGTTAYIGGFAGIVSSVSELNYCSANVVIDSNQDGGFYYPEFVMGALVGKAEGAKIDACRVSGTISMQKGMSAAYSSKKFGGIIGTASSAEITNVYSDCSVLSNPTYSGSIAFQLLGVNRIDFVLCFNDFTKKPENMFYSQEIITQYICDYYDPTRIGDSNGILDFSTPWKSNPLWKKGKLHPELVSYEEYLTIKQAA